MTNVMLQFVELDLVNINVNAKFHHNVPLSSRDSVIITFSEFWSSTKLSQSLGLDVVSINVYATVYQNILLSSRDRAIIPFSDFGVQQSLDR